MHGAANGEYRGQRGHSCRWGVTLAATVGLALHAGQAHGKAASIPPSAVAPARIASISAAYRGTPYKLDCLGEARHPDKDPLFTRKYADCQTLVEQVMAEALAPHMGGLDNAVRSMRYMGGDVSLAYRYHYCIPDWLNYPWPVRDVTAQVGGKKIQRVTRRIDRNGLLAERGANGSAKMPVRTVTTPYIPRSQVRNVLSQIPHGTIVVFVLDRPGIVAGHLGFAFRTDQGVILRHASQRKKRVIDEPLSQYIGTARKSVIGIKILQPDVRGLSRDSKS